jgi:hypothetical protein
MCTQFRLPDTQAVQCHTLSAAWHLQRATQHDWLLLVHQKLQEYDSSGNHTM